MFLFYTLCTVETCHCQHNNITCSRYLLCFRNKLQYPLMCWFVQNPLFTYKTLDYYYYYYYMYGNWQFWFEGNVLNMIINHFYVLPSKHECANKTSEREWYHCLYIVCIFFITNHKSITWYIDIRCKLFFPWIFTLSTNILYLGLYL